WQAAKQVMRHTKQLVLRPLKARSDDPPHYQYYDCANDCSDETRTLASLIPPHCLAKVCCHKSSDNPEQGSHDKSRRLVLVSRMKELRDHSCHKPNNDGPKNTHCLLPLSCALALMQEQRTQWVI